MVEVVEHLRRRMVHTEFMPRDSLARHLPNRDAEDTGDMLGVSSRSVRRLAARRELASHKVGGLLRFSQADIEDFIHRTRTDSVT
jgi:excisionase family DNA binding protein